MSGSVRRRVVGGVGPVAADQRSSGRPAMSSSGPPSRCRSPTARRRACRPAGPASVSSRAVEAIVAPAPPRTVSTPAPPIDVVVARRRRRRVVARAAVDGVVVARPALDACRSRRRRRDRPRRRLRTGRRCSGSPAKKSAPPPPVRMSRAGPPSTLNAAGFRRGPGADRRRPDLEGVLPVAEEDLEFGDAVVRGRCSSDVLVDAISHSPSTPISTPSASVNTNSVAGPS